MICEGERESVEDQQYIEKRMEWNVGGRIEDCVIFEITKLSLFCVKVLVVFRNNEREG